MDFIAQERFNGGNGSVQNNQPHTTFTSRNSEWMYDKMEALTFNDATCNRTCTLPSFSITGNTTVCTSQVYSLSPAPTGATITWSASPTGIVTIAPSANGTQATVTKVSAGNVTITASATNSCVSQPTVANLAIHAGGYSSSDYPVSGPSSAGCNSYVTYSTVSLPGATNYAWFYPGSPWTYVSGQGTTSITLITPSSSSSGQVGVRVANACDAGGSPAIQFTQVNCFGLTPAATYTVSPNPASNYVSIVPTNDAAVSAAKTTTGTITEVNIYDQQGTLRKHQTFSSQRQVRVNVSSLSTGIYFVEIVDTNHRERHQLSVLK